MSWFVRNLREMKWWDRGPRGFVTDLIGDDDAQVGVNLFVLAPGEPMAMYHWEADQEDFLVMSGEALLIVEGEERPLRAWDLVHCPPETKHTIVGAGAGPSIVVAVGTREHDGTPGWGGYTVDEVALRHEAGVEQETTVPDEAYAPIRARRGTRVPTRYHDGWLQDA